MKMYFYILSILTAFCLTAQAGSFEVPDGAPQACIEKIKDRTVEGVARAEKHKHELGDGFFARRRYNKFVGHLADFHLTIHASKEMEKAGIKTIGDRDCGIYMVAQDRLGDLGVTSKYPVEFFTDFQGHVFMEYSVEARPHGGSGPDFCDIRMEAQVNPNDCSMSNFKPLNITIFGKIIWI